MRHEVFAPKFVKSASTHGVSNGHHKVLWAKKVDWDRFDQPGPLTADLHWLQDKSRYGRFRGRLRSGLIYVSKPARPRYASQRRLGSCPDLGPAADTHPPLPGREHLGAASRCDANAEHAGRRGTVARGLRGMLLPSSVYHGSPRNARPRVVEWPFWAQQGRTSRHP